MKSKEMKRSEAIKRQDASYGLTPLDRLNKLELRGHGHCKEAKRLHKQVFGA